MRSGGTFRRALLDLLLAAAIACALLIAGAGGAVGVASAITFDSQSSTENGVATSLSLTVPAAAGSGDVMIASVDVIGSSGVTVPTGWTLIRTDTNSAATHMNQSLYWHVVNGSEPAGYVWQFSSARGAAGGITDYSGVDAANPIDASSGQSSVKSSQLVGPSLSTSLAGDMLVGSFGYADTGTIGSPAGMTQRFSDVSVAPPGQRTTVERADQLLTTTGPTGSRAVTLSQPVNGIGQLVALRPDVTPPSAPSGLTETGSSQTSVTLGWQASTDNVGVIGYAVYQGSVLVANPSGTAYTLTGLSCGSTYNMAVSAYDASGNYSTPAALTASTGPCPIVPTSVTITAPSNGAVTAGSAVAVSATTAGTAPIAGVQFQLDGAPLGAPVTTMPYTLSWDTTSIADGSHVLTAVATDTSGNSVTSAPITVSVANSQGSPPVVDSVSINEAAPATNDLLDATITAHDPAGLPLTYSYQWLDNGAAIPGATSSTLDLSQPANGNAGDAIALQVSASDGVFTSAPLTSPTVTIVNSPPAVTVSLSSTTPDTDATITATSSPSDADGNPVTLTYVWSVNGTPVQQTTTRRTTDSLDLSLPGHGDYGDAVTLSVTPNDGTVNGPTATAAATVTRPPTGTILEYPLAGAALPSGLTTGPDGNLWFTLEQNSSVGRMTPAGAMILFAVPTPGNLGGINPGPDGNIWFTEFNASKVGRITPNGIVTEFPVGGTTNGLGGIVAGADGNMWFAKATSNQIGKITMTGAVSQFTVPTANSFPHGLNLGPDGNVWFAEFNAGKIANISPSGVITQYKLPASSAQPDVIVAGPDGNMWFTEYATGKIGRITTAGVITEFPLSSSSAGPVGISAGPDGNLWFAERTANRIGRITTAGVITEFPVPTAGGAPDKVVDGPDGNLWFTEHNSGRIARITP